MNLMSCAVAVAAKKNGVDIYIARGVCYISSMKPKQARSTTIQFNRRVYSADAKAFRVQCIRSEVSSAELFRQMIAAYKSSQEARGKKGNQRE